MNPQLDTFDQYKGEVARIWRTGDISPGTVHVYFSWVRRFYRYCKQHRLEATAQLTLVGAKHFGQSYTGPKKMGRFARAVVWLQRMRFMRGRLRCTKGRYRRRRPSISLQGFTQEGMAFR